MVFEDTKLNRIAKARAFFHSQGIDDDALYLFKTKGFDPSQLLAIVLKFGLPILELLAKLLNLRLPQRFEQEEELPVLYATYEGQVPP